MKPKAIELTIAVQSELQGRLEEADRLRMLQVERARHEAQLAQRRYMQVDPDNRLVATPLEADWNEKLRVHTQALQEAERKREEDRLTLDQATESRIRALAEDFPAVFNDSATSHRDRKRMAQLLIEDVTLLKTDELHVHIRFKGGLTESLALPLPQNAWRKRLTHPDVVARVEKLLEHHDEQETAERLNSEGLLTGAGKPFDRNAVCWVRYTHGLKSPLERLLETGKLTIAEMTLQLGLREGTVRQWARDGRLKAKRHGRKAIWLIDPVDEQPEAIQELAARCAQGHGVQPTPPDSTPPALRARIDELLLDEHSDHSIAATLNEQGWPRDNGAPYDAPAVRYIRKQSGLKTLTSRLREEGMMTTAEMAACLGIGLKTVGNWVRASRLRGQLYRKTTRPLWLFEPIDKQPEPIRQLVAQRATLSEPRGLISDAAAGRGAI
jgi:hypothetical protein